MNPERREQLVREFEAKFPKPNRTEFISSDDEDEYDWQVDHWSAQKRGWLLAHSDSEMSKDAERLKYLLDAASCEEILNERPRIHAAIYDPREGEWNIVQGDEARKFIDTAIKEDTDGR